MKSNKLLLISVSCIVLVIIVYHCTYNITGGSSDTEVSASISGTILDSAGNCIPRVNLRLRPSDYLPGDTISAQVQEKGIQMCDDIANEDGTFKIDSVVKGEYVLEIFSDHSTGMILPVHVDTEVTVSAVLEPFGTIAGEVYMNQIPGNNEKITIELFGTEHRTKPDTTGHFSMFLPYGPYRMRMSADSFPVNDMELQFYLDPQELHHLGTLPMAPYPKPCFNFFCDSVIVRSLLDDAGYPDIHVYSVSRIKYGRINKLNFRGIKLKAPITAIGQLNALEELDLGNTGISDSCRFLASLWTLETLLLDSNNITGVSQVVGMLKYLNRLDLSNNYLTTLPKQITFTRPWYVNLNGNVLCSVSDDIGEWADRYASGWRINQQCDANSKEVEFQ